MAVVWTATTIHFTTPDSGVKTSPGGSYGGFVRGLTRGGPIRVPSTAETPRGRCRALHWRLWPQRSSTARSPAERGAADLAAVGQRLGKATLTLLGPSSAAPSPSAAARGGRARSAGGRAAALSGGRRRSRPEPERTGIGRTEIPPFMLRVQCRTYHSLSAMSPYCPLRPIRRGRCAVAYAEATGSTRRWSGEGPPLPGGGRRPRGSRIP